MWVIIHAFCLHDYFQKTYLYKYSMYSTTNKQPPLPKNGPSVRLLKINFVTQDFRGGTGTPTQPQNFEPTICLPTRLAVVVTTAQSLWRGQPIASAG